MTPLKELSIRLVLACNRIKKTTRDWFKCHAVAVRWCKWAAKRGGK